MRRLGLLVVPTLVLTGLLTGLSSSSYATGRPAPADAHLTITGPTFVNYGPRGPQRLMPQASSGLSPRVSARPAGRMSTTPTPAFTNATSTSCTSGLRVNICVHYQATATLTSNDNGCTTTSCVADPALVPNIVSAFKAAESKYVASGYRAIEADPATPAVMNVYLEDMATWDDGEFTGAFGITAPASDTGVRGGGDRAAYMVLDNDFACSQYGDACHNPFTPTDIMRVTVAHEFFHATQFAYDALADPWFMEATATWAETQVFPSLTDNRSYLYSPGGAITAPNKALDTDNGRDLGLGVYQNFIFFQYLGEHYPALTGSMPTVVLNSWKFSDASLGTPTYTGMTAVARELKRQGSSLTTAWRKFSYSNRKPASFYQAGAAYPASTVALSRTLSPSMLSPLSSRRYVPHLASQTIQLVPQNTSRTAVRLAIRLSNTSVGSVSLLVRHTNGSSDLYQLNPVNSVVRKNVSFSSNSVRSVELVFANAGASYRPCWPENPPTVTYTCDSQPTVGNIAFAWTASFYRV